MPGIAEASAVTWITADNAVLDQGRRVLMSDRHRLDGVAVIVVDEHLWRHTRRGGRYVTVAATMSR